ncbi:hypothetical protein RLEG3_29200 [Rhizobium leguminosarum bv. trifolii WSM1689]|nr:hypothetical protein RLEG3_29200 [Rhizobium leguminosarum bv. trifolii WSM1689]
MFSFSLLRFGSAVGLSGAFRSLEGKFGEAGVILSPRQPFGKD